VTKQDLKVGDLVQLNPQIVRNQAFAGAIMVISEPKPFGAQGYVQVLGENREPGGQAYYRANWDEMEKVGIAYWVAK